MTTIVTYVRASDGSLVHQSEALDEKGVLRDGMSIRRSAYLMDSRSIQLTDEEQKRRDLLVDAYNKRIGDAWRDPAAQSRVAADAATKLRDEALARTTDAYDRYDRRLQDAWR